jgi:hypothetical protein
MLPVVLAGSLLEILKRGQCVRILHLNSSRPVNCAFSFTLSLLFPCLTHRADESVTKVVEMKRTLLILYFPSDWKQVYVTCVCPLCFSYVYPYVNSSMSNPSFECQFISTGLWRRWMLEMLLSWRSLKLNLISATCNWNLTHTKLIMEEVKLPISSSFLGSTAQLRPRPPPQNPAEFLGGFSTIFFFTG